MPDTDYPPQTEADRAALKEFARDAPFVFGTWKRFKSLYKTVEGDAAADSALLGALLARIDRESMARTSGLPTVHFADMGAVTGLVAQGDALFALGGRYYWQAKNFAAFLPDPADLMKLRSGGKLDNIAVQGYRTQLVALGDLVCFVSSTRGNVYTLYVIDVVEPSRPRMRGQLVGNRSMFPAGNAASFPYVYVTVAGQSTNAFHGLRAIDLSDPDAPKVVGEVSIAGLSSDPGNLAISGNLAAVISKPVGLSWRTLPRGGGLRIIDIANPTRPREVGGLELATPLSIALHGQTAYVGIGSEEAALNGLQIVDLSEPRSPRKLGFVQLHGFPNEVAVEPNGHFVYVSTSQGHFYTVDVRQPSSPMRTATIERSYASGSVTFVGDLAYVPTSAGIALYSLENPEHPLRVGAPPSPETIGYLKRRGRRTLRKLAKTDLARYVATATELLLSLASDDPSLDPARHWAALDILFGAGGRFRQTRHGRGRYIGTGRPVSRLSLRTREERLPAVWDAHPEALVRLLQAPKLPLPVYAFAARALRAAHHDLPAIDDATATRWLAGDEPLLIALAVRSVAARLRRGEALPPVLAADAFFRTRASERRALALSQAGAWAAKRTWAKDFAERLATRLQTPGSNSLAFSRRQSDAATLLARHFDWVLIGNRDLLLTLAERFLASGRPELQSIVQTGAQQTPPNTVGQWLRAISGLSDAALREPTLLGLLEAVRGKSLERAAARAFVFDASSTMREDGWRLLAASATEEATLATIWTDLLASPAVTPALTTAMSSAYALSLLTRAGIGASELAAAVAERPFLVELLSPDAFAAVASQVPALVLLNLIAASPEAHWQRLRPIWLQQLREGIGTAAIWNVAETAVRDDATGNLEARLLGDREIAETFLALEDAALLDIREPAFGSTLGAWMRQHANLLAKDSATLLTAATHPLPDVRTFALERVAALGMSMPFALRLIESAVPPSMAVGRAFFDSEPSGGDREFDYALALCDSPVADVRRIGCEYVASRWNALPHERVLLALFENPAPEVQAFVAERLTSDTTAPTATPLFDAEVLRALNRARVAKERVKTRQTAQATLAVETLQTVARSRTPRDAEWALGELARRVARGETVEGVTLEGVVGV